MVCRKPWVGGNWKCNGTVSSIETLCTMMAKAEPLTKSVDVIVAPSPVHVGIVASKIPKSMIATQNVSQTGNGAFTGETSPEIIRDMGLSWTLIGHSERRARYGDTNEAVAAKVEVCQKTPGLNIVICIGEQLAEREANKTVAVLKEQMDAVIPKVTDWSRVVIAYEPVWAIGTGKVASNEQAQEAHAAVRAMLKEKDAAVADSTRIVYGGSVTDANSAALIAQPDVDGFLVGGASLKPGFIQIIESVIPKA